MKLVPILVLAAIAVTQTRDCAAQSLRPQVSFEQLFPQDVQRSMGLHKLSAVERQRLHLHTEALLMRMIKPQPAERPAARKNGPKRTVFGNWRGTYTEEEH
jgi:hypothetical protein